MMIPVEHGDHIRREVQEGLARIVMNRPEKKNALTTAMYAALTEALQRAASDNRVRAILIQGAGGCFTSGNDLADFRDHPPRSEDSPVFQFMHAISRAEKPIVAAVAGPAVGIGTTMLLHCDLVYAATDAKFAMPFVNLGLCAEAGSSLLLPLLAGHQRAAELLLLGEPFSAEQAKEIGLVNEIRAEAGLLDYALEQARKLAAKPPASLRLTKALLKKSYAQAVETTISEESRHIVERVVSPEAVEAFTAFFERRKPDFTRFA